MTASLLDSLKQASLQESNNTEVQRLYLEALHHAGKFSEALQISRTLIKQHSELTLPWFLLAQQSEKEKEWDKAEFYYSKVISLDAKHLHARVDVALLTMSQLRLPESRMHFREAISILLTVQIKPAQIIPREKFDTAHNETLLWRALALLAHNGIHAVAHAGTLLGLVREGALLPEDKDLDLALPHNEIKLALDCLLQDGWERHPQAIPLINPITCRHKKSGLTLDLCGVRLEKETGLTIGGFWTLDPRKNWQRVTEFNRPFSIQYEERAEGKVWVLINPEHWLTDLYGDWEKPDPEFDSTLFSKNIRGFSLLTQCYAYNRLIWHWQKGRLSKAHRIALLMSQKTPNDALLKKVIETIEHLLPQNTHPNTTFSTLR